jgi:hypothetical protein
VLLVAVAAAGVLLSGCHSRVFRVDHTVPKPVFQDAQGRCPKNCCRF